MSFQFAVTPRQSCFCLYRLSERETQESGCMFLSYLEIEQMPEKRGARGIEMFALFFCFEAAILNGKFFLLKPCSSPLFICC